MLPFLRATLYSLYLSHTKNHTSKFVSALFGGTISCRSFDIQMFEYAMFTIRWFCTYVCDRVRQRIQCHSIHVENALKHNFHRIMVLLPILLFHLSISLTSLAIRSLFRSKRYYVSSVNAYLYLNMRKVIRFVLASLRFWYLWRNA